MQFAPLKFAYIQSISATKRCKGTKNIIISIFPKEKQLKICIFRKKLVILQRIKLGYYALNLMHLITLFWLVFFRLLFRLLFRFRLADCVPFFLWGSLIPLKVKFRVENTIFSKLLYFLKIYL